MFWAGVLLYLVLVMDVRGGLWRTGGIWASVDLIYAAAMGGTALAIGGVVARRWAFKPVSRTARMIAHPSPLVIMVSRLLTTAAVIAVVEMLGWTLGIAAKAQGSPVDPATWRAVTAALVYPILGGSWLAETIRHLAEYISTASSHADNDDETVFTTPRRHPAAYLAISSLLQAAIVSVVSRQHIAIQQAYGMLPSWTLAALLGGSLICGLAFWLLGVALPRIDTGQDWRISGFAHGSHVKLTADQVHNSYYRNRLTAALNDRQRLPCGWQEEAADHILLTVAAMTHRVEKPTPGHRLGRWVQRRLRADFDRQLDELHSLAEGSTQPARASTVRDSRAERQS